MKKGNTDMQYSSVTSLFKYISSKYIMDSITKNSIYCPTPDKLNDPFDSKIYFMKKPKKTTIDKIVNEYKVEKTEAQSSIITYPDNNKIQVGLYEKYGEDFEYVIFRNYGLYSMTTDHKSLLMWSHYGDQHKGFCIEWERKPGNLFSDIRNCFPINYSSYMPDIDYEQQTEKEIAKIKFGYKNDVWSYEKEWRFITALGNTEIPVDSKILGLYIGCNAKLESTLVEKVIAECKERKIKTYKAQVREREYKIDYIEINEEGNRPRPPGSGDLEIDQEKSDT